MTDAFDMSWIDAVAPLFWQLMFGCTVLLTVSAATVAFSRRSSAALRHRLWCLGVLGAVAFPTVTPVLPAFATTWWQSIVGHARNAPHDPPIAKSPFSRVSVQNLRGALPVSVDAAVVQQHANPPVVVQRPAPLIELPLNTVSSGPLSGTSQGLVIIWLAGVCLSLIGWTAVELRARAFIRRAGHLQDDGVQEVALHLSQRLRLRTVPRILSSPETTVPLTAGWLRPLVVLPADVSGWDVARPCVLYTRAVAHRSTGCHVAGARAPAPRCTGCIRWRGSPPGECESSAQHACDDAVLQIGEVPAEYATLLVDVASVLRQSPHGLPVTVAMVSRSDVEQRIRAILQKGVPRTPVGRRLSAVLLTGTVLAILVAGVLRPAIDDYANAATAPLEEPLDNSPTVTLEGIVFDPQRKPVTEAHVRIFEWSPYTETFVAEASPTTTANSRSRTCPDTTMDPGITEW